MQTHSDSPAPRLAPTGSREPGWARLPDEPPHQPVPHDATTEPGWVAPIPPDTAASPDAGGGRRGAALWQVLLAGVVGAGLALVGFVLVDDDPVVTETAASEPVIASPGPAEAEEPIQPIPGAESPDAASIADKVIPSIVTVEVAGPTSGGSGSGVIMSSDGLIITNDHVIDAGSEYQVILSDGRTAYDATLVGTDPLTDLAVLQVDATGLTPVEFGDTSILRVGDPTVAVGSPLGLEGGPSLTVGVLSAFGRQVQVSANDTLYGMLQTDAPITQGSSGGALVDAQGRLIGITTAVGVSDVGIEGIGFATPIELVQRVVDELVTTGETDHAFLGILGATSFADAPDGASVAVGVQVESVEPETGAEAGGLLAGDLIVSLDGDDVTTMDDLIVALRYLRAGDAITLTVSGDDGTRDLDIVLGPRP
jgi:putative serine protease PepD